MIKYCPACGSEMVLSTEEFAMSQRDGAPVVSGVPHFICPACGQIKFTPDQLRELHEHRSRRTKKKELLAAEK